MREVARQLVIVGLSCIITLAIWLGLRMLLRQSHSGFSTSVTYVLVLVIYLIIRQVVEIILGRVGFKRQ